MLKLFQTILAENAKQKHIVAVSATLKELSDRDMKSIGLNLTPRFGFFIERNYIRRIIGEPNDGEGVNSVKGQAFAELAASLHLEDAKTKGKTLVSI